MMGVSVTLVLAAVVAGLATFLSPCVLPIVPVVLATGATGGRRRPLGVALGLALAFVVFTLAASRVLAALGLPQDLLHTIAVVLLAFAGLMLLVPSLAEWAGRLFQPLAARAGGRVPGGDGFASGLLLGAALSVVWTPCAGPILAAVTALAAEHHVSGNLVLITVAYAAGATVPLFVLVLLGQRAVSGFARVRRHGLALRRASGVVLLLGAWLFTTNLPTRLAAATPGYLSWIQSPERASAIKTDLRALDTSKGHSQAALAAGDSPDRLKDYGPAPDFAGHQHLDQHARVAAALAAQAARQGRAGRLLDVLLRELHSHAPLPEGLGRALSRRGPRDRRRAHARVRVRARRRQRAARDARSTTSATPSPSTTATRRGAPGPTSTGRPTT